MFSYIYMKILESRPRRYDRGVRWLSFGHSEEVRRKIAQEHVEEGSRVLEIGVGTGTFALLAAQKGASVLGFDISPGMLEVAEGKIHEAGMGGRIELRRMGVAQMDELEEAGFDLVAAMLVFSELSPDEQDYSLHHCHRVLKPGGKLVVADETRPRGLLKKILYHAVRAPLLAATYLATQTTTKAVTGIEEAAKAVGFRTETMELGGLGSFFVLTAVKVAQKEGGE